MKKRIPLNIARLIIYPTFVSFFIFLFMSFYISKLFYILAAIYLILLWIGLEKTDYGLNINRRKLK